MLLRWDKSISDIIRCITGREKKFGIHLPSGQVNFSFHLPLINVSCQKGTQCFMIYSSNKLSHWSCSLQFWISFLSGNYLLLNWYFPLGHQTSIFTCPAQSHLGFFLPCIILTWRLEKYCKHSSSFLSSMGVILYLSVKTTEEELIYKFK